RRVLFRSDPAGATMGRGTAGRGHIAIADHRPDPAQRKPRPANGAGRTCPDPAGDEPPGTTVNNRPDALLIGAGPAGLMAAEMLARAGRQVVIADAMPTPARKFLMAGKSGLYLTKTEPEDAFATHFNGSAAFALE